MNFKIIVKVVKRPTGYLNKQMTKLVAMRAGVFRVYPFCLRLIAVDTQLHLSFLTLGYNRASSKVCTLFVPISMQTGKVGVSVIKIEVPKF